MRLNIIGNGFDLYHGLPCSYYYFGCFLASNYPDFYKELSDMYGFSCLKRIGHDDFEIVVSDIFWKTFEEQLGYLDSSWMEGKLLDDLGLECDDPVDLDIPESVNSKVIKEKFCEWVCATVNTRQNFDIIKSIISPHKCHFRRDDFFVSFNYTQTLEEIYKIPSDRIIHIHGECKLDAHESELVVGHGNDKQIEHLKQKIDDIENDVAYRAYQSVRNRLNEYECEKSILLDLKKDVSYLSSELIWMLRNRNLQIDEIKVWGMSCGPVDEKYIEELHREYPTAKWQFSCFEPVDEQGRRKFAEKLGLAKVMCFALNNPNSDAILDEIVRVNNITKYEVIR